MRFETVSLGVPGPLGPPGPPGSQGIPGETGPQGPPGEGLEIKGSVPDVGDLPDEGNEPGDVWIVTSFEPDHLFMWDGDSWIDLGEGGGGTEEFDTVADMLASMDGAHGTGTVWRADGFRYREAYPAATDHHLTTAGGVKLYVQPTDDGWYNFLAMDPARDGVTDDYPLLRKLLDIRPMPNGDGFPQTPPVLPTYPLGPSILFPQGAYYMNPGVNGVQIKACTHLRGVGPETAASNVGKYSELRFPSNNKGLCFNFFNTLNGAIEASQTGGAVGSSVRQMSITSGQPTSSGAFIHPSTNSETAHGIEVHCPMTIERVVILNFSGDGIHLRASAGVDGNDNLSTVNEVSVYYCRNGVYIDGSDSNAGIFTKINGNQNRRWGINDSSFLGNTWIACHAAGNGIAVNGGNPADSSSVIFYAPELNFGETTGSITTGTRTCVVNSVVGLQVGMGINIAGVTGVKTIQALSAATLTLTFTGASTVADATVSGAAITLHSSNAWQPTDAVCWAAGSVPNTQAQAEADLVAVPPGVPTWVTGKDIDVGDFIVSTNLKVYKCSTDPAVPSINAPTHASGTAATADGYGWDFMADANPWEFFGSTGTGTVTWVAGKPAGTYFGGGNYLCDNPNSGSVFVGTYAEAGTRVGALRGPSMMLGGPAGFRGDNDGTGAALVSRGGSYKTTGSIMPLTIFGGDDGNILQWNHRDDGAANTWRLRRPSNLNDYIIDNGASAARQAMKLTGEYTLEKMGTGAGIPYLASFQTLALGVGSFMRRHTTLTTAPTTGNYAVGDVIWNTGPGVSGSSGWRCTTAGTFGTLNAGATTGSITNGSTSLTVSSATGLAVGNAITIAGVAGTKWVTAISGTTITIDVAANATVSGAAVAYAVPVITRFGETVSQQTLATNVDFTLTPGTSPKFTRHTGTLTADRAVTLSTTNAYAGLAFRITRTGGNTGGPWNLNVGTGPLKPLITNTWCEVVYDGTTWNLSAYGAL